MPSEVKRNRWLSGMIVSGSIIIAISAYLRWISLQMTGYDALRNGAAWLDVSARGKIKLTGEDRARLLHAMTTNHIQQLTPGTGCYAFFLTVQGRILADVNILCRPDHFLLDVEPETREKVYQHLDHYIIADDVTLGRLGHWRLLRSRVRKSAEVLQAMGAPVPDVEYSSVEWGTRLVARLNTTGSLGFFVFAPEAEKAEMIAQLEAAGAVAGDAEAFAWCAWNTARRATAKISANGFWRRRRTNRTRCTSAKAAIWVRRSWSACGRAGRSIGF